MDTAGRTVERVPVAQFVASARPAGSSSGVDHSTSAGARRQPDPSVSMFVSNPAYDGDGGYMDVEGTASPPDRLASDVSLITDTGFRQESDVSLITDFDGGHSSTAVASAPPPQGRRASVSLRQISDL